MLLHLAMRDDGRAGILERLAARDVVVVVMAVDQVLDRRLGDLLDLVDILLSAGRPAVGDRIGGDDAVLGDDEHRLMVAVAEDVDVVGAFDLGGFDRRPLRLLCQRRRRETDRDQRRHCSEIYPRHQHNLPWFRKVTTPLLEASPRAHYSRKENAGNCVSRVKAMCQPTDSRRVNGCARRRDSRRSSRRCLP